MKSIFLLSAILFCSYGYGQDYKMLAGQASDSYVNQDYKKSVELYRQAFQLPGLSQYDLYNAACSAALAGDRQLAMKWLKMAFEYGYVNVRHVKTDADLDHLHTMPDWKPLLLKMQKKVDQIEANYDKPLQKKLLGIYDTDQKYRLRIDETGKKHGFESKEMTALWKVIEENDSINLIKVKEVLDQYGWVGEDKIGRQANSALFLVIQHADLSTQQKYLPVMRKAVNAGKAYASELALLEDRVALGENRRQIYGSQIGEDSTGTAYVLPLEDPEHVDQRRETVGLGPLADYVKHWDIKWDAAEYKKELPVIEKRAGIK